MNVRANIAWTFGCPRVMAFVLSLSVVFAGTLLGEEQTKELGPVKVTTSLTPDELSIGDEVVLEIRVEALGDVEVLMPEFGEALDRYRILDFVPQKNIRDDGSSVFVQRYTLQPSLSGDQSIPPILVEFVDNRPGQKSSPDDLDAYEILTERFDFTVQSVLPENASNDLKPPLGELQPLRKVTPASWIGLGLLGTLAIFAAIFGFVYWKKSRKRVIRRNAYDIARQRLDVELAKPTPKSDAEVESYFVALSKIVRRYLEDRFDLRAPDLTTEEFLELAGEARDLSRAHKDLLRDFLKQADLVKFAGVRATADDIQRAGDLASQFLDETRENAPDVVVDSFAAPSSDTDTKTATANSLTNSSVGLSPGSSSLSEDKSRV